MMITTNKEELLQIIEKVERLEQEKADLAEDIKGIFEEAKSRGYDVKILKELLKLRKMEEDERLRKEEELETYKATIGMK